MDVKKYIKKLKEERRKEIEKDNPNYSRDYLREQYKRFNIHRPRGISHLEPAHQAKILSRDIDILTGEYQKMRAQIYIDNYIEAMEKNNISLDLINKFKTLVNVETLPIVLPFITEINLLYVDNRQGLEDNINFILNTLEYSEDNEE